ncbi:IS66 family transposase, partial [Burkholderia ubonensis]|uniref:IS66 family transposase n=1 Tax=Burkholderia ubonensis TaxID=101571 RepID=UPI000ADEDB61
PKAARSPDLLATRFVVLIGKLFAAEARSAKWKAERRQRLRARYSARVLAIIERMLVEHLPDVVPSSLLGKALQYMSGQWHKLVRYVGNGNWRISNNLCENAIRPFVVGRKSWLFSDTVAGAQASANLYSLVETCKANGVEPYRYLVWLFTRLPLAATADDYATLMPWSMPAALNR